MEKIYSKTNPEILLHVISRSEEITPQRQDLSPEKEYLQVACFSMNKDKTVRPHKHIKNPRAIDITQESWIVLKGAMKIILYDIDDKVIKETILKPGDCLVTFRGGHNFSVLEDNTIIYEHKTGPYQGREKERQSID